MIIVYQKQIFGNDYDNKGVSLDSAFINLIYLEELVFGDNFNQKIKANTLPISLKKLVFGKNFNNNNQPIDKSFYLSKFLSRNRRISKLINLEELTFGDNFNQEINKDTLPKTLKIFRFGKNFSNNFKSYSMIDIINNLIKLELLVWNKFFKEYENKIKQINIRLHIIYI
jgi:hypothetical protein